MKKRSQIIWLKQENNTTHISLLSIITSLVIWILLMVGLWLANLWMVSDVFPAVVLEKRDCLFLIIWILFVLSMEEALHYICKNESIRVWLRRSITVLVLGFGILGLCFYGFKRSDRLRGVMQAIADGTITEERIQESLMRIYRVKYKHELENAEENKKV